MSYLNFEKFNLCKLNDSVWSDRTNYLNKDIVKFKSKDLNNEEQKLNDSQKIHN